ncbi:MAG TPA: UrcA family protein [Rhizomicrobium sp.]|jgi:UrcA family protein
MLYRSLFASAALVCGMMLSAAPVMAQDTTEGITVYAPRVHVEPGGRDGLPEKISLSRAVAYDDLDLTTYEGARDLRYRVRDEARDICHELAEAYPVYQIQGASCLRDATRDALIKADHAISDAREYRRYDVRY